jgi:serine protease Do
MNRTQNHPPLAQGVLLSGLALALCVSLPLAAQRAPRAQRVTSAPVVVADFENASRSYLGVGISDISSERLQALKLKDDRGVEITQVDQDAPAGKAGLKENDVIVAFNSTPVESAEQFKRLMRETPPGRTVAFDILRDGQPQTIKVQLADRKKLESSMWPRESQDFAFAMPAPPAPPVVAVPAMPAYPAMPAFPHAWDQTIMRVRSSAGLTLESLSPQLGDFFGVKNGEGLLVRTVQKGSAAEAAGVRAGDIIMKVGDQKISDNSDWNDALRSSKSGKVSVVVMRDRKEVTLSMTVSPRHNADSSSLFEGLPDQAEMAGNLVGESLDEAEPCVEQAMEEAAQSLEGHQDEINDALRQALDGVNRELIDSNSELNRSLSKSMKLASAELKRHGSEIDRAMREAQRSLEHLRMDWREEMQ